jgi:SAM-dependent methyltransferase
MKNILNEKPLQALSGRLLASVQFVTDFDLKNKIVLDIGCGYGWCELNFLERGVKNIKGIEISEKDLETIRSNVHDARLDLSVSSATSLPFDDNYFDTIVSWEVIEHIPKDTEKLMFSEVARVLRPGGSFYLSTPNRSFFSNAFDPAWWLVGHRHYSWRQLERLANAEFLSIQEVKIYGGWWSILCQLNMYISKWIFRSKPLFEIFFAKKENNEYAKNNGFLTIFIKFKKAL